MKKVCSVALVLAVVCILALGLQAQEKKDDKKEVTLKGTILCAMCALKQGDKCQTAVQIKEKGKEVVYLFDDKGDAEKYHEPVCGSEGKEGSVTGVISEKDGKKYIKPSKVEYANK